MGRRAVLLENSLAYKFPMLAEEWDDAKNEMKSSEISYGNAYKAHWICKTCNHHWQATVNSRTRGNGCPECKRRAAKVRAHEMAINTTGSLQDNYPNLALEWHTDKNAKTPNDVVAGSHEIVWWKCEMGHEWQAEIKARVRGNGCPYCAAAMHASFPELAIIYYLKKYFQVIHPFKPKWLARMELDIYLPELNIGIEYDGVYFHRDKETLENLKEQLCMEQHIRLIRIREYGLEPTGNCIMTEEIDNDYVYLNKPIVELLNNLEIVSANVDVQRDYDDIMSCLKASMKDRSIAHIEILNRQYDVDKNRVSADKVLCNSNRKVWWKDSLGHSWQDTPAHRFGRGSGCPYCAGKRVLKGYNDLATKSPNLATEWNYMKNGELLPSMVTVGTNRKVWWNCKQGHEWEASVASRSRGNGCPYCAGQKVLAGYNDLASLEPLVACEWDYKKNNDMTPQMVTVKSNRKVWWKCKNGHEWQAVVSSRTGNKGTKCPICGKLRFAMDWDDDDYMLDDTDADWDCGSCSDVEEI